jgi:hypothetical protein
MEAYLPDEANLTDEAYRNATLLPKYSKKDIRVWKMGVAVSSRYMPRDCDLMVGPFNLWTIEEKLAWVDHQDRKDKWLRVENGRLGALWNERTGGFSLGQKQVDKLKAIQEKDP